MPDPSDLADLAAIRIALTSLPPACRFHGTKLEPTGPTREACCDTGKPSLRRRTALEALDRLDRQAAAHKPHAPVGVEPVGVQEYGHQMAGGGYHVWNLLPELLKIYPLDERIEAGQRFGGVVAHRRILVLDDWEEI